MEQIMLLLYKWDLLTSLLFIILHLHKYKNIAMDVLFSLKSFCSTILHSF